MVTLEAVRSEAVPELYPRHALRGCETALVLFAAAWHGKQDAIWMAEAGITATCVDTDHGKLGEMVLAYPEGWEYVHGDAFEYAQMTERRWDVVSIDCPTNLFDRCAELLPLWCSLARKAVVLGSGLEHETNVPAEWHWEAPIKRSDFNGGVYWEVFTRC